MILNTTINEQGVTIWPRLLKKGDRILIKEGPHKAWNSSMDRFKGQWVTVSKNLYEDEEDLSFEYNFYRILEDDSAWCWQAHHAVSVSPPGPAIPKIPSADSGLPTI